MTHSDDPVPHRAARNRIAHLLVDLFRIVYAGLGTDQDRPLGPDLDIVLVAAAISIGHTERRPMTASMISRYLGIPRTTVLRRTAQLIARGVVVRDGAYYLLSAARLAGSEAEIRQALEAIAAAGVPERDG